MGAPTYGISASADVSCPQATAKTILGVKAHANSGLLLKEASVSFAGTSASAEPVLVELCYCTFATAGTSSAAVIVQRSGRVLTAGFTANADYSAEPTVLSVIGPPILIHPQAGVIYQIPLGDEPDSELAQGFAIRVNAPAVVDCRPFMLVSRC